MEIHWVARAVRHQQHSTEADPSSRSLSPTARPRPSVPWRWSGSTRYAPDTLSPGTYLGVFEVTANEPVKARRLGPAASTTFVLRGLTATPDGNVRLVGSTVG